MADIKITLYQFNKRENSTALPDNAVTSVEVTVLLKDITSYDTPKVILESSDPTTYNVYTYAYIDFFSRYYFIDKRELDTGGRLILHMREDYLGSFRTEILAITNAFIEYSSQPTNMVIDRRLQELAIPQYASAHASLNNTTFTDSGPAIISSTGNKNSGLFILQYTDDIYTLFDGIDWDDTLAHGNAQDAIWNSIKQFVTKDGATRNLRNAFTVPWVVHGSAIGQQITDLTIGSFPTGKTVYRVANDIVTDSCLINIPWTQNDYRRSGQFTTLLMYLPLFGLIELPTSSLSIDSQIRVTYAFSYANGDVNYQVEGMTSNHIVATGSTNASAPLAVGTSNINNGRLANSIAKGAAGVGGVAAGVASVIASGGLSLPAAAMIGGGALTAGSGVFNAYDAIGGASASSGGGFGGFACGALDPVIHLYLISKSLTESPTTMAAAYGYPRNGIGSLSGLTGYTKLSGYDFAYGNLSEKVTVSSYLNTGFYIE